MGDWIPLPTDQNSLRENRLRAHRKKIFIHLTMDVPKLKMFWTSWIKFLLSSLVCRHCSVSSVRIPSCSEMIWFSSCYKADLFELMITNGCHIVAAKWWVNYRYLHCLWTVINIHVSILAVRVVEWILKYWRVLFLKIWVINTKVILKVKHSRFAIH